jgi:hippurate hydrolase
MEALDSRLRGNDPHSPAVLESALNLVDSFADISRFVALRRDIHMHPELGFEEHRTSQLVADKLREWGVEVHTGIAGTGVVGVLRNGKGRRSIGLRADLDALPLQEENHFAHRSRHDGRMHACGHDGHTTMLLAAAWHLAQTRDFDGTVNFIFQPAEEMGKAGALKMVQEGLFERFPCDAVFALHNFTVATGSFAVNPGPLMASSNTWKVTLHGRGTHASQPHTGIDPVAAVIDLAQQLQTLLPKVIPSTERALLAVTQIQGSGAPNVIPDEAWVGGTARTFSVEATDKIEAGIRRLAEGIAAAHGCRAELGFRRASPPVVNHEKEARFAADVMREIVGADRVDDAYPAVMAAEDFAHMLRVKPGCYAFIGNGDGGHRLPDHGPGPCIIHNTSFDFNDEIIPIGASYFVRLAQKWLSQP